MKLKYVLLAALIFTAATNLFWKILPNFGFVGGLQIDYLIPKLFFSDLVGLMIIATWILEKTKQFSKLNFQFSKINLPKSRTAIVFALFYFTLFARQFFTPYPIAAVWFFMALSVHVATLLIALSWIRKTPELSKKILIGTLAFTVVFQSAVGIYQFVNQKQLFGFLFFGEPQLTRDIGLSKGNFANVDQLFGTHLGLRILPYGTTPHPNVLAGFLVIGMLILVREILNKSTRAIEQILLLSALALGTLTLLLTTSVSAGLAFFLGASIITFEKVLKRFVQNVSFLRVYFLDLFIGLCIVVPIALHLLNVRSNSLSPSLARRDFLNQTAVDLISRNVLTGIGMNQFNIAVAESSQNQKETVPFIQPAHHTPLLFLAENGILGVLLLILFCKLLSLTFSLRSLKYFLILLPILTLDHYFYSLIPGQWMLGIGWLLWML